MEENQQGTEPRRVSPPTDKMMVYAQRIANKVLQGGVEHPEYALAISSFDDCKQFIDRYAEAANRPTEKQIAFAVRIAKEKGIELPEEAVSEGRKLSQWIDANKGS